MHPSNELLDILTLIILVWTVPWKAYAVWMAVKREEKRWFVAVLFLNTLAILEIYYIFKVVKKTWPEAKSDFTKGWESLKNK